MIKAKRKTIEQQIAEALAKLNALKARQKEKSKSKAELTAECAGMNQLLDQVASVAKANKTTVSEVVRAIAKIKKTKLKIESCKRAPKKLANKPVELIA